MLVRRISVAAVLLVTISCCVSLLWRRPETVRGGAEPPETVEPASSAPENPLKSAPPPSAESSPSAKRREGGTTTITTPESAAIRGTVVDASGLPVSGVDVELVGPGGRLGLATTDAAGAYMIDASSVEAAPDHGLRPVPAALPGDLTFRGRTHYGTARRTADGKRWPSGTFAHLIEFQGASSLDAPPIVLTRAARVVGRVIRADTGEAISNALIDAQPWREPGQSIASRRPTTTRTLLNGAFEARIDPGTYSIRCAPDHRPKVGQRHLPAPPPLTIHVAEGATVDVGTFALAGGTLSVRGRVIDQDGAPVEDLSITLYNAAETLPHEPDHDLSSWVAITRTTTEGLYEFNGVYPAVFRLTPGFGEYEPTSRITGRRLTTWSPPLDLDLRNLPAGATHTLEDLQVRVSRPFQLDVELTSPDPDTMYEVRLELADPSQPFEELDPPMRHKPVMPSPVMLYRRQPTWTWSCHTPHPPVEVTIRRGKEVVHRETVHPIALERGRVVF